MSNYAVLLLFLLGMLYLLGNGIFAIKYPDRWLTSKWTTTRGLNPDTSPRSVRMTGIIYIVLAIVMGIAIVYFY